MEKVTITKVNVASVHDVTPLFDAYRQFYAQQPDLAGARDFLVARVTKNESVIFLATENGQPVGFAQLYPSFSSLSTRMDSERPVRHNVVEGTRRRNSSLTGMPTARH